jgi:predicted GNAT family N-acyltransferase
MKELCEYADANKLTIVLSPSERNKQMGTTSKARLTEFYKRFGFVENRGKNKDFRFTASMYRTPR